MLRRSIFSSLKKFKEVFGKPLSSKDQPSHVASPTEEQKQTDKDRRSMLVAGKVRGTIKCGECLKPRCIYSNAKLTRREELELVTVKESNVYTCGASLFPRESCGIVVREALVCTSPTESQNYSATLVHFPPVCYYCGLGEESLVDSEEIQLKQMYAIVHPICFVCLSDGKKPFCRKPPNVAKKQKTS